MHYRRDQSLCIALGFAPPRLHRVYKICVPHFFPQTAFCSRSMTSNTRRIHNKFSFAFLPAVMRPLASCTLQPRLSTFLHPGPAAIAILNRLLREAQRIILACAAPTVRSNNVIVHLKVSEAAAACPQCMCNQADTATVTTHDIALLRNAP